MRVGLYSIAAFGVGERESFFDFRKFTLCRRVVRSLRSFSRSGSRLSIHVRRHDRRPSPAWPEG